MSAWKVTYTAQARQDFLGFDKGQQAQILKAVGRVAQNPLPQSEGGYGKPLGDKDGTDLTGYLKIKLLRAGIRIVYRLQRAEHGMEIVVIGMRADSAAYKSAARRTRK